MSCCEAIAANLQGGADTQREELFLASRRISDGVRETALSVPDMHCGGCMRKIETGLAALPGVRAARANLSTRRVTVRWDEQGPPKLIEALQALGYSAHLHDDTDGRDKVLGELLRALAVAGFASSNIMILSVSVWAGAEPGTRDLFHWISALIAVPAILLSGRVFFRSAWAAVRRRQTNMDVPITIGVLLSCGMSLYDTATGGPHAYFDASISLLFFLLVGRTLDYMMRERARAAVKGLQRLTARGAQVLNDDGSHTYLSIGEIVPGMRLRLAVGERAPVDGIVESGRSDFDCALVTGESAASSVRPGDAVQAGVLNLTAPLTLRVTAAATDSFLSEMVRMMEAAEQGRSAYRRVADRMSRLYAPLVHLAAFLTFVGWMAASGDWHRAMTIAVAVLIVTCPCALGLAVPMVHVMAARRLFEAGIMVKDGSALERMAETDYAVFDKTGTLTLGRLRLRDASSIAPAHLDLAASLAAHSRHPQAQALAAAASGHAVFDDVAEIAGCGLEAHARGHLYRLGSAAWTLGEGSGTVLTEDGVVLARFSFEDRLRPGAAKLVTDLHQRGMETEIVSGDGLETVRSVAGELGISKIRAGVQPGGKIARLSHLALRGKKVLMVGDGLNDAPALAAAHASMAPASGADIGRAAADFVFLRDDLSAVLIAHDVARRARMLVRQNFVLALAYNLVAVPLAISGYVTPLVAALAMSGSSIVVIANALRLRAPAAAEKHPGMGSLAVVAEPAE
jgi:Cu2+-exporting ATPase